MFTRRGCFPPLLSRRFFMDFCTDGNFLQQQDRLWQSHLTEAGGAGLAWTSTRGGEELQLPRPDPDPNQPGLTCLARFSYTQSCLPELHRCLKSGGSTLAKTSRLWGNNAFFNSAGRQGCSHPNNKQTNLVIQKGDFWMGKMHSLQTTCVKSGAKCQSCKQTLGERFRMEKMCSGFTDLSFPNSQLVQWPLRKNLRSFSLTC